MNIYQLKISLAHVRPLVWRRIQVPADIRLGRLHDILQICMGWQDCHLHLFVTRQANYGVPDPDSSHIEDERPVRLDRIADIGDTLGYEYDFGDGWLHEVKVEKSLFADNNKYYPLCLAGNRACPPEDCGGPPGYQRLLRILRNPEHREYEDMLGWAGEDFDPKAFNLVEINRHLWRLR